MAVKLSKIWTKSSASLKSDGILFLTFITNKEANFMILGYVCVQNKGLG